MVTESHRVRRERYRLAVQVEKLLDPPATYLAFVFAGALALELVLTAQGRDVPAALDWLELGIWAFFGVHFLLGFGIAPEKLRYVRRNWLTVLSLAVPFLRVIRVLRVVAVLRAVRLVRIFTSLNRTAASLRRAMVWNSAGLAIGLATSVLVLGSAGLFLFEAEAPESQVRTYADALWWCAATLTSVGAAFEPITIGGRVIALFVMVAGLVLLGYVAGVLSTMLFSRRVEPRRRQ